MKSDMIDLTMEIAHETENAVLVHDGDKEKAVWLPKSAVEIIRESSGRPFAKDEEVAK